MCVCNTQARIGPKMVLRDVKSIHMLKTHLGHLSNMVEDPVVDAMRIALCAYFKVSFDKDSMHACLTKWITTALNVYDVVTSCLESVMTEEQMTSILYVMLTGSYVAFTMSPYACVLFSVSSSSSAGDVGGVGGVGSGGGSDGSGVGAAGSGSLPATVAGEGSDIGF